MKLDLTGLTATGVGDATGIPHDALSRYAELASRAHDETRAAWLGGEIGFPSLVDDRALSRQIMEFCRRVPPAIDTVVVVGIGGSSLGPNAVYSALSRPLDVHYPRSPAMPRRLFFPDNSDPETFAALLDLLPLERTLWNVVTKSGGTAETAAQTLAILDRLQDRLGREHVKRHVVVTTDPERGALRELGRLYDLPSFPVPDNVGGRFSVLSAVGLLPAALAGLDIAGLLDGGKSMRERVLGTGGSALADNPALMLAAMLHWHDRQGRNVVVLMPYADKLLAAASWFKQLWGESLGKATGTGGEAIHVGSTPVVFRGATDQHSQLQLYAEGPDDKVYLTMSPVHRDCDLEIPSAGVDDIAAYSDIAGYRMSQLIDAQLIGTRSALAQLGRPIAALSLERIDAYNLGEFFMLMESATAFAGTFYGVDPYDQPGVEAAKTLARAALTQPGSIAQAPPTDSRYAF